MMPISIEDTESLYNQAIKAHSQLTSTEGFNFQATEQYDPAFLLAKSAKELREKEIRTESKLAPNAPIPSDANWSPFRHPEYTKQGKSNLTWQWEHEPTAYNMTRIKPWLYIGEGPGNDKEYLSKITNENGVNQGYSVANLFKEIEKANIKHVMRIGNAIEEDLSQKSAVGNENTKLQKFIDYATGIPDLNSEQTIKPRTYYSLNQLEANYTVTINEIKPYGTSSTGINYTQPSITRSSGNKESKLDVYDLTKVNDGGTLDLNDQDTRNTASKLIADLHIKGVRDQEAVLAHCSAGLGRSGSIAFTLVLLDDFDDIFDPNHPELTQQKIQQTLATFRMLRPRVIQTAEQYTSAIQLAISAKQYELNNYREFKPSVHRPLYDYYNDIASQQSEYTENANNIIKKELLTLLKKFPNFNLEELNQDINSLSDLLGKYNEEYSNQLNNELNSVNVIKTKANELLNDDTVKNVKTKMSTLNNHLKAGELNEESIGNIKNKIVELNKLITPLVDASKKLKEQIATLDSPGDLVDKIRRLYAEKNMLPFEKIKISNVSELEDLSGAKGDIILEIEKLPKTKLPLPITNDSLISKLPAWKAGIDSGYDQNKDLTFTLAKKDKKIQNTLTPLKNAISIKSKPSPEPEQAQSGLNKVKTAFSTTLFVTGMVLAVGGFFNPLLWIGAAGCFIAASAIESSKKSKETPEMVPNNSDVKAISERLLTKSKDNKKELEKGLNKAATSQVPNTEDPALPTYSSSSTPRVVATAELNAADNTTPEPPKLNNRNKYGIH